MADTNDEKNFVTMKAKNQLAIQAIEQAVPLICAGKISPINIHGIGPKPRENRTMKAHMDTSGINPIDDILYS